MLVAQLSPQLPGEVHVLNQVPRGGLTLTHGAFLACGDAVSVSSRIQRSVVNSIFSGAGLAVIDVSGQGPVAFSGFGALLLREVPAGEELLVDNGKLSFAVLHVLCSRSDLHTTMRPELCFAPT
jgi:uncharacterized protein (AIM24 family)